MVSPIDTLELVGGELALDFTNSLGGSRERPSDRLHGYPDLVEWAAHAGAIDEGAAKALLAEASERPEEGERVFRHALELRETIFRIFRAVADGEEPDPADIERLNADLGAALGRLRVVRAASGCEWCYDEEPALDRPLWPIVRSAAELLVSGELDRVKRCGGHDCDWLFVDRSKNRSRRWCDMRDCGNRAKARRHYQRTRGSATG